MNGYIPDCTNIGTTFVNSIANMLSCASINVNLQLDLKLDKDSNDVIDIEKFFKSIYDKGKSVIQLGSVRYG